MDAAAFARRALRAFAPVVLMIAIVTVGLAVVATAIPRSVNGFLTDGLRYDAAAASAISRDVLAQGDGVIDTGPGEGEGMSEGASDVWGLFDDELEELRQAQPAPLRDTLDRADYTIVSTPVPASEVLPDSVSLGYDPRFLSRVSIVEGHEPEIGPGVVPGRFAIEVIASAPVADALGWSVGDTATLELADRLVQDVTLAGIFEAKDPDDPYWEHTTSTLLPTVDKRTLPAPVTATVFADPAGFAAYAGRPVPFALRASIWYSIAPQALDASTQVDLTQQLRKFSSATHQVGGPAIPALLFHSNLPELLDQATARSSSSQAILATILAGPIGLAVAIEVLVARLAAARLRGSLVLLQARGASAAQRRLLLAVPGFAVGLAATAVGLALALLLPGGVLGTAGVVAIAATSVAPAALLVLFAAGPERTASFAGGRLRLVAEAVVALATAASVASAVQRGNTPPTGAVPGGVDLVAAAVPLTISLLGCILTLRLYPVLLRRSLVAAHRSPGVSAFLGVARALRAGSAGLVPVLAVLIGVSIAVFSGALSATLVAGTQAASESRVGADLAVDDVRVDPAGLAALGDIDGVAVAAGVSSDVFHSLAPQNVNAFPVTLVLVDPQRFEAAQAGTSGALYLPDLTARPDGTVPLAVSTGVAAITAGEGAATLDRNDVALLAPALSGEIFNTSQNWVIGDIANAEALDYPSPVVTDQVFVKLEPGASVDRVEAAIAGLVGPDATFSTADRVTAQRAANPAIGGIRTAALLAILGAAVLSAAALALTTVLDGRTRRSSLALLATLGLGRRQARRTVAWELAPLSGVGLVVGVALGAVLAAVVLTTVNLRPFTAGLDQPAVTVDPWLMLAIVGGFALLLVATVVAGARQATRRARTNTMTDGGWDS